jgi:glutamine synthetase
MLKQMDNIMIKQLLDIEVKGFTIVEYIWIGGTGHDLRSKAKTFDREINSVEDLPLWNYDGSSTYQASTEDSEITLKPVALFKDPFRKDSHKLCLCETLNSRGFPTNTNFRHFASKIFSQENKLNFQPWFGLEQEYVLVQKQEVDIMWPYLWPKGGYPKGQGQYYCSVGAENAYGRYISDLHYKACLYAGVKIYGTNAEVMPSQWEFQIGTLGDIEVSDHMWVARYILERVGEYFNVSISYSAKPVKGDWNGSGCHTNFSTQQMRTEGGYSVILDAINKLGNYHSKSITLYGEGNEDRLTGLHETSSMQTFSFGSGHRGCSVRIPKTTEADGYGYFEDRRPAANIDPYIVTASLFSFSCLDGEGALDLEKHYEEFIKYK